MPKPKDYSQWKRTVWDVPVHVQDTSRSELMEIAGFLVDHEPLADQGCADAHVLDHEAVRASAMIRQLERAIVLYFAIHASGEYPSPSAQYEQLAAMRRIVQTAQDTLTHMSDGLADRLSLGSQGSRPVDSDAPVKALEDWLTGTLAHEQELQALRQPVGPPPHRALRILLHEVIHIFWTYWHPSVDEDGKPLDRDKLLKDFVHVALDSANIPRPKPDLWRDVLKSAGRTPS